MRVSGKVVFRGVHVWALCRTVKVFPTRLSKPYMDPVLGTTASLDGHYGVALKFVFTGVTGIAKSIN